MPAKARIATAAGAVIIALAVPLVGRFEGKVNTAYPDVVRGWALPTVCNGHTGPDVHRGETFTDEQCAQLRDADLRSTYDGLAQCIPVATMPNYEQAAFLSLAFNGGFAMVCKSSIPGKLEAGNHAAACATISEFVWSAGKDCRVTANNCGGIVRRRAAERSLCEGKG